MELKKMEIRKKREADPSSTSILQYDGYDHMIIKKGDIQDFNTGSQLIVHEGQQAIFFRDGKALGTYGPGRHIMSTGQTAGAEKLYSMPGDSEKILQSEIYFVNTTIQMGLKWGTDSKVLVIDPPTGVPLFLGANGLFSIRISNPRKLLLKIVGTDTQLSNDALLGNDQTPGLFRGLVMTYVKNFLAEVVTASQHSLLTIYTRLVQMSEALRRSINVQLDDYGLELTDFFIHHIEFPTDDVNFKTLCDLKADAYLKVETENVLAAEAKASTQRKYINAMANQKKLLIEAETLSKQTTIQAAAEAEALRLRSEAEAADMERKGYNYQQETNRMVGLAAMKNGLTGDGGGDGDGDGGGGGGGIGNMAALGLGLGAVGSIAGFTKNVIGPAFGAPDDDDDDERWNCSCGQTNLSGNFCPRCGKRRPASLNPTVWDCPCGKTGLTGNFCPECGRKRGE